MRIKAAEAGQQSLTVQHVMNPRDATRKSVRGIEQRGVRFGNLRRLQEERRGNISTGSGTLTFFQQFHRLLRPTGPMSEQATGKVQLHQSACGGELKLREQIEHDVVVVARVERDVARATGLGDRAHHVEGLIAVERGDLDAGNIRHLGKPSPEVGRKQAPARRRLEIESEHGDLGRHLSRMFNQLLVRRIGQRREGKQADVVAEFPREPCFGNGLAGFAADAGDLDRSPAGGAVARVGGFRREFENRLEQCVPGIANGELRGVDPNRDAARAGRVIVARQRALVPFVELSRSGQCEWMRWNDQPFVEPSANFGSELWAGCHVHAKLSDNSVSGLGSNTGAPSIARLWGNPPPRPSNARHTSHDAQTSLRSLAGSFGGPAGPPYQIKVGLSCCSAVDLIERERDHRTDIVSGCEIESGARFRNAIDSSASIRG